LRDRGKFVPEDVALANARWQDFKTRMDADRRRPPPTAASCRS